MPDQKFRVEAEAIAETEKALLVVIGAVEYWIPQSQIDDESEVWKTGDVGELVVSIWIAEKKGLL